MLVLKRIFYSFPVQLVIMHFKKNKTLLVFWLLLFGLVTSNLGATFGSAFLFLDPEYMGKVNFWGFLWLGMAIGFFMMVWNISSYMMQSFRFPFLATLYSPFYHFSLNNSLIPLSFLITYCIIVIRFQYTNEFAPPRSIIFDIGGFLLGILSITLLTAMYFSYMNHNLRSMLESLKKGNINAPVEHKANIQTGSAWEMAHKYPKQWRVDYFVTQRFKLRAVRGVEHYSTESVQAVFQQNHKNALVMQIVALFALLALGFLMDIPAFQLPAAASFVLVFSMLMGMAGAFSYWFTEWRTVGVFVLLVILNFFSQYEWINYHTKAYGLQYKMEKTPYNNARIKALSSDELIKKDMAHTLPILDNWKAKVQPLYCNGEKPNMLLLNYSGGGIRATVWSMWVSQQLDKLLDGQLLDHTFLMTGASGGIVSAAYLRELHYLQQQGTSINLQDTTYLDNIAQDYLNPMALSIAVNDLFYPMQSFEVVGQTYRKNRAYMFEKQLHLNTDSVMGNRTLKDYAQAEQAALIPMLLISPTIINDSRKLFISSQPVSYLTRPFNKYGFTYATLEPDGIDFQAFFKKHHPENLLLSSAIRMNATYPFILPPTFLPTEPLVQVMDAGFRDNYGFEATFRFLYVFQDWLKENVNQVICIQVRAQQKVVEVSKFTESLAEKMFKPLTVFVSGELQDNYNDFSANFVDDVLEGKLEVLDFEYIPSKKDAEASMSFHLTKKEKLDIQQAIDKPENRERMERLRELMNEER